MFKSKLIKTKKIRLLWPEFRFSGGLSKHRAYVFKVLPVNHDDNEALQPSNPVVGFDVFGIAALLVRV